MADVHAPLGAPDSTLRFSRISVEQTLKLRHEVLWPDKSISHVQLPEDKDGFHFGAFLDMYGDEPIAVISFFLEALPIPGQQHQTAARFRKFACDPRLQGRGIGTQLLQNTFQIALHDLKVSVIWCDARLSTSTWYEKRGMVPFGETFFKGPVEYVRMKTEGLKIRPSPGPKGRSVEREKLSNTDEC
ncbi:gnat family [Moniliophthora roreri MCA 2997]|uniref:Gnat family n=1 Tax=Moniliophthora roreri (strain MCA 2997) TaxID=1381753 RepID=V2X9A6_MONRO|nr:gnat family [Moniliophthora roreri MCA 2997]KAI3618111.1 gnat family [Moniliophthora roreri]